MKKILAFSGSNSSQSINQKLLIAIAPMAQRVELEFIDLRDYPADIYGVDLESEKGFPQTMQDLYAKTREADGFLIAVPEHNGSMPAVFKNSIDWISRMEGKIFNSKPTVFLSASPGGRGGAAVLEHLNKIMPHRGADLVGTYGVAKFFDKLQNDAFFNQEDFDQIKPLVLELEERVLAQD